MGVGHVLETKLDSNEPAIKSKGEVQGSDSTVFEHIWKHNGQILNT